MTLIEGNEARLEGWDYQTEDTDDSQDQPCYMREENLMIFLTKSRINLPEKDRILAESITTGDIRIVQMDHT